MKTRVLTATIALAIAATLIVGCSNNDESEWQRIVCEVQAVNGGVPLVSAYVVDGGDGIIGGAEPDDSYPNDIVSVLFEARPYSLSTMTIPEGDAYSSFIITGYNLTWHPGPNTPAGLDLSPFNLVNQPFYLQVPIGGEAEGAVLVANRELKEAVLNAVGGVAAWGFEDDFNASLELGFIGHDSGSEHEVTVPAGLLTNFTLAVTED